MLRFRLGPFPVAVEPIFWITAAMLGFSRRSVAYLLVWVAVVFASVLIHEMGHAAVALALGGRPTIVLRAFGGVTLPMLRKRPSALAEVVLSIAGPLAGLSLWLVALAIAVLLRPQPGGLLAFAVAQLAFTSIAWAVLNLIPVLDLDGGHVLLAALTVIRKKPSRRLAAGISVAVAAAVGLYAWLVLGETFLAIFFALFLYKNASELYGGQREPGPAEEAPPGPSRDELADVQRLTEVARRAMAAGDPQSALAAADLLESSEGDFRQAAGLRIRAGVMLAEGKLLDAGLLAGRSFTLFPQADAAVVAARANLRNGDLQAARTWVKRSIESGAPADAVARDAELGPLVA